MGIIFAKSVFNRRMFDNSFLEKAAYSLMIIVMILYIVNFFTWQYLLVDGFMHCQEDAKDGKGSLWSSLPFFLVMIDS